MTASSLPPDYQNRKVAVLIFVLFAAILTGFGYWYYQGAKQKISWEKYQTLAAIGELKSKQIQQWRKERLAEVERAAKDELTLTSVKNALASPADQTMQTELRRSILEELTVQDKSSALIFDTHGNLVTATDTASAQVNTPTSNAVQNALASNRATFSDFYRDTAGIIHIDVAAPVRDGEGQPLGALVLSLEADSYLYPLIQSWPTPSKSAETLLVERRGDEVFYLNELRHRGGSALSMRSPITDTQKPAVQAVLGKGGIFQGKDYRDIEVVSDLLPIPGSPWFLVAKVDAEEILADVRSQSILIILIIGLCILLAAGAVAIFYRQRQVGILKNLIHAENEKAAAQETVHKITDSAQDAILMMNPKGRISYWNPAAERIFGYTQAEALGQNLHLLISWRSLMTSSITQALKKEPCRSNRHQFPLQNSWGHWRRTSKNPPLTKVWSFDAKRSPGCRITFPATRVGSTRS